MQVVERVIVIFVMKWGVTEDDSGVRGLLCPNVPDQKSVVGTLMENGRIYKEVQTPRLIWLGWYGLIMRMCLF